MTACHALWFSKFDSAPFKAAIVSSHTQATQANRHSKALHICVRLLVQVVQQPPMQHSAYAADPYAAYSFPPASQYPSQYDMPLPYQQPAQYSMPQVQHDAVQYGMPPAQQGGSQFSSPQAPHEASPNSMPPAQRGVAPSSSEFPAAQQQQQPAALGALSHLSYDAPSHQLPQGQPSQLGGSSDEASMTPQQPAGPAPASQPPPPSSHGRLPVHRTATPLLPSHHQQQYQHLPMPASAPAASPLSAAPLLQPAYPFPQPGTDLFQPPAHPFQYAMGQPGVPFAGAGVPAGQYR